MIVGTIENLSLYSTLIDQISEINEFYKLRKWPPFGEWFMLSGKLKVIRLNDWNRDNEYFEAHRRFYDLHITLKGIDKMKIVLDAKTMTVTQAYDQDNDYLLFKGDEDGHVLLQPEMWTLIYPNEPHRNEFVSKGTEKLVFKIAI